MNPRRPFLVLRIAKVAVGRVALSLVMNRPLPLWGRAGERARGWSGVKVHRLSRVFFLLSQRGRGANR
jgi:hypothetical protein